MLTKRVLESLILAGAFDSLGYARRALLEKQEKVSAPIAAERKAEAAGQFSLFGGGRRRGRGEIDESVLQGEEFDKRTLLRFEKEMLGQFVTDHPLLGVRDALAAQTTHEIGELGTSATATSSRSAASSAASPASTRSAASPTRSSGSRASPQASTSWRSPTCTRPCRA